MSRPIKIIIVDDHDIVIDGLKSILNPFAHSKPTPESVAPETPEYSYTEKYPFQIVGIANSGEALLERMANMREIDIVVMDYYMKGMNGLDTAVEVKKNHPAVRVLLFSMEDSDVIIAEAFARNVDGYVTKEEGRQRLVEAIKRVHKGERVFPGLQKTKGGGKPLQPAGLSIPDNNLLSKRETEVACLISNGHTTQQIADVLGIAFNTVEVHRNNIYKKLDINRLAELVKYAMKNNLCR